MTTEAAPRTKAGKRLLDPARPWLLAQPSEVAAIEAEAVATERARIRAAVGRLFLPIGMDIALDRARDDALYAVLALLEETP